VMIIAMSLDILENPLKYFFMNPILLAVVLFFSIPIILIIIKMENSNKKKQVKKKDAIDPDEFPKS
ncbi:MAG: hypothetical protein WCJ54_09005, partial [Actinomycetota bacterium]